MTERRRHDLIIVGGGIAGVICLHYARKAGLDVLLLEKQGRIGGLWARLPSWQDIQFAMQDWTLADIPIAGVSQPDIAANIQAWVDRFDLHSCIRLAAPVVQAIEANGEWRVETPGASYICSHLVCATGSENIPYLPPVIRDGSGTLEFHSSEFHRLELLAGKKALVVGGGASALDLLELCLRHGAEEITWVYRSVRWMVPTIGTKQQASRLRAHARRLMDGESVDRLNEELNIEFDRLYRDHGIESIKPAAAFDLRRDQLIPGRADVIRQFARIRRHPADVRRLAPGVAELSTGDVVGADVVLWGTGFQLDLGLFASPVLSGIRSLDELGRRCGPLFRSIDAPRLYFLAVVLGGSTLTQWAYAHACRSIVADVQGGANPGGPASGMHTNEIELIRGLALHDPDHFPADTWAADYRRLLLECPDDAPLPLPP
jgi:cation diffusion facilitator CzcD-associated flavoprotein CzcO